MDKNRMGNDKIIAFDFNAERPDIHRLLMPMPEFHRYGLWIINASTAGRSPVDGFHACRPRKFEFYSISHLIDGAGRCWIDGRGECEMKPGQLVAVSPGTLNRYGGDCGRPYVEDSIRFTGPVADMLYHSGVLRDGVCEFGTARKLLPIAELIQDPSNDAQINANITLQKLLVDLYFERRRSSGAPPVEELLEAIKSRPKHWWTVEEMAEFCNLSPDQFRRNIPGCCRKAMSRNSSCARRPSCWSRPRCPSPKSPDGSVTATPTTSAAASRIFPESLPSVTGANSRISPPRVEPGGVVFCFSSGWMMDFSGLPC